MTISEATHATELAYLLDVNLFLMPYKKTPNDIKVVDTFTTIFTNFAKYGDPNGNPENPKKLLKFYWDPLSEEQPETFLRILPSPVKAKEFKTRRIERFAGFYAKLSRYFSDKKLQESCKSKGFSFRKKKKEE